MPRAPAGLPAVQQPPALAPLLEQHQGRGARPWHQQHPPTDAPLLLIEQHLNGGEITGKGIGHGHGAKDPPSRRPRARAGDGPSSGALLGNGCWWRPACAALARGPQHGKGRGAGLRRNLGAGGDALSAAACERAPAPPAGVPPAAGHEPAAPGRSSRPRAERAPTTRPGPRGPTPSGPAPAPGTLSPTATAPAPPATPDRSHPPAAACAGSPAAPPPPGA